MASPDVYRYTVGWIAPMPLELAPGTALLDEYAEKLVPGDDIGYHVGRIGHHWVVMAVCHKIGTHPAANVLANMRRSFPNIKHVLVVGIAGAVPCYGPSLQEQIVLGDIVVGCPQWSEGGVAHYESGAWKSEVAITRSGHTLEPSAALQTAVNNLRASYMKKPTSIPQFLRDIRTVLKVEAPEFEDPGGTRDFVFSDEFPHSDNTKLCSEICDFTKAKPRSDRGIKAIRQEDTPHIHYGTVGSANTLVVSSAKRDELYKENNIICFEMEAAGVVNSYQALVIRGICDYADSHKNKIWQKYAAATAAAYAKEVLLVLPPVQLDERAPRPFEAAPQRSQDHLECLQSLAFPQMDSRYYDIGDPATSTCRWFFHHGTYKSWAACDQGLLWIKGKPGAGKSTLLKYALDNFRPGHTDLVLSFFFHGRGDELQKTPLGLFRCLLHQILRLAPNAIPEVVQKFRKRTEEIGPSGTMWKWPQEELWSHLKSSLPKILEGHSIWLFVDALDECGEKDAVYLATRFKALLQGLPSYRNRKFHICFTCRHYPILEPYSQFEIRLEIENEEDIAGYVKGELSTSPTLSASITERASGVFLWAYLVVQRVLDLDRQGEPEGKIRDEIDSIPSELTKLYKELVSKMGPRSVKLIEWICFSGKPLELDELRWAMVIDSDHPQASLNACMASPNYIPDNSKMERQVQTLSCGLAEAIIPHTKWVWPSLSPRKPIVQFIHQSVKDFFISGGLLALRNNLTSIHTAIVLAHHQLSKICVAYLRMEEIEQSKTDNLEDFPFFHYAAVQWPNHAGKSNCKEVAQNDLLELFSSLANRGKHVDDYYYRFLIPLSWNHLLHVVAAEGLSELLRAILQRADSHNLNIDAKDHWSRDTPLLRAARNGHANTVKILLDTGRVDINSRDEEGRSPLSHAAGNGHARTVKILLNADCVDINSRDEEGRSPLSHAVKNGHTEMAKLLLDTGCVNINSRDGEGRSPLSHAAGNGHAMAVKILLDTGCVDINSRDEEGWSPLSHAARRGHTEIVKLLLATSGISADLRDKESRTPLSWAAGSGHVECVRLLLQVGDVDADSRDRNNHTPLCHAVVNWRPDVIKLLLDTGKVDIKDTSLVSRIPRLNTIKRGDVGVVKLLFNRGRWMSLDDTSLEAVQGASTEIVTLPGCSIQKYRKGQCQSHPPLDTVGSRAQARGSWGGRAIV